MTAPAEVSVDLGREAASELARRELARPEYQQQQPSPVERVIDRVGEAVNDLLAAAESVSPAGWGGLVVLVAIVVALVVALRLRVGPMARAARADRALFLGRVRSAAEHRAAADAAAGAGAWEEAVRERLRAVVRALEERGLLDPRPGRTADEAAREAGAVLPDVADDLAAAARTFDDVWYGERPGTPEHNRSLRELDDAVRRSRPVLAGTGR